MINHNPLAWFVCYCVACQDRGQQDHATKRIEQQKVKQTEEICSSIPVQQDVTQVVRLMIYHSSRGRKS